ncbi:MAG TPA: hypothetical protein VGG74_18565 [Kofleriaceae bacterium]
MRYALVGLAVMACGRLDFDPAPGAGPIDAARDLAGDGDSSDPRIAPQFVQYADTTTGSANAAALAVPYTMDVTVGDLLVVCAGVNNQSLTSLSDTTGDLFTVLGPVIENFNVIYTAYAIAGTSGPETVGVMFDGSNYAALRVHEYADVDPVTPLDTYGSNTGTTVGSDVIEVSLTTATENELVFAYAVSSAGIATAGTGFNARSVAADDISEDRIEQDAGTYEVTANNSGTPWAIQALAFRGREP